MKNILILFFSLFALNTLGQDTNTYTLDKDLKCCLDSAENYSTAGMANCVIKAFDKWDKKLNENYKELMSLLTDDQKILLRDSQRKWIEFRDKEIKFSNDFYNTMGDTM